MSKYNFFKGKKALIVGGKSSGLIVGHVLNRLGFPVYIFQQNIKSSFDPLVSLWSPALKLLQQHDPSLLEKVIQHGTFLGKFGYRDSKGKWFMKPYTLTSDFTHSPSALFLKEKDLLKILREDLETKTNSSVVFRDNCHVLRFEIPKSNDFSKEKNNKIAVEFRDEKTGRLEHEDGYFIVGSDGLWSDTRSAIYEQEPSSVHRPKVGGYTIWRGFTDSTIKISDSFQTWGLGRRFSVIPLKNGVAWFATSSPMVGVQSDLVFNERKSSQKEALLRLFKDFHQPIPEILNCTHNSEILQNQIFELPILPTWTRNRMVLVGDAAHALDPILAQGVSLAFEDAFVLGSVIQKQLVSFQNKHSHLFASDQPTSNLKQLEFELLQTSFKEYQYIQIPRIKTVRVMTKLIHWIGDRDGKFSLKFRDFLFHSSPHFIKSLVFRLFMKLSLTNIKINI